MWMPNPWRLAGGLLALSVLICPGMGTVAPVGAQVSGKQLLTQLIEGARKEGQLNVLVVSSQGEAGVRELNQAFNRRFGLNVKFNGTIASIDSYFSRILEELKIGIDPSFDAIYVAEEFVFPLMAAGGLARIDNWEALLKEISPEAYQVRDRVSPPDVAGYAFAWGTRAKVINYNTDLISESALPQTRVDMGDPKYAGMYFLPPFITDTQYGILTYPRDKWLEVVRSWSRWKPPILTYVAGLQRMFLGEFKFAPSNDYYQFQYKGRDPKTPIGMAFFKDLTPLTYAWYVVSKGAKHLNAAKLFALWATSSEANRIFENLDYSATGNLLLGTGPMSRQIKQAVEQKNIKLVSWWDSKKNLDLLRWFGTPEGAGYSKELAAAQTGRE